MHSNKATMPLQLLSIFTFILLFLSPVFSTGQVAKPGCKEWCGNLWIQYPFGVGSECSLHPSFTLTCNSSTHPPRAYLTVIDKEVVEINETYIRVKYPNLVSVCYDLSGEPYKRSSMSVNLSGTPYTLLDSNTLTAIGCDDMVLGFQQSNGTYVGGGCSAVCLDKNDTGGIGYCPNNYTSLNNGCCQAPISRGIDFLGAQLIDLSAELLRGKLFPCSYAFVQEDLVENETVFSYPLHYLDNTTTFLNDNWASTTRPPVVRLQWMIIGAENCSQAYLNSASYACKDSRSVCADETEYANGVRGYQCSCLPGYEGNPYLSGGCNPISVGSSIAKSGCPDQCGELSIPFPFGVGPNCYLAPSFEIICNTSNPIPYLSVLNAEIVELNSSRVLIHDPNHPGLSCYNLSDQRHRMSKIVEHSFIMNLTNTQYTLSDDNWITAVGCDDMVVGTFGQANQSSVSSVCSTICSERPTSFLILKGYCSDRDSPGDGCCSTPIPRGTTYLEAYLIGLGVQGPSMSFSCSYTFVRYISEAEMIRDSYPLSINAAGIMERYWGPTVVALDWRIGAVNCKEAQQNQSTYACVDLNSDCVDFDATFGGYLCNCSKGYQGNPYITSGCQDINECGDTITSPCNSNSICINTQGSFTCLCPKGYNGDGRQDGKGCIQKPLTKMILILTGAGSGLGFLILLLILFWLYKLFQRRKETILREKLFERNGGLLLRRQTNEGALGKTKLFPSKELEIATDYYNRSRILGQGGQGTVYKDDERGLATRFLRSMEENHLDTILDRQVLEQGRKEDVILVAKLAKRCLHLKGKMRPTMKEVATELESIRICRSLGSKDQVEEAGDFEDLSTMIYADAECTWSSTTSYKTAIASSSDTQPLIFSTE